MSIIERERVACELLGIAALEVGGFAPCPGAGLHSKGNGRRDFRVTLATVPTGFCFHSSCGGAVDAFNLELRRRIWRLEHGARTVPPVDWGRTEAEPRAPRVARRPRFDIERLREMAGNVREEVDAGWLRARSPMPVVPGLRGCAPDFLEALYDEGEKVLVFTKFESQGQYGYHVGRGGWRMASVRGVKAVPSALPLGAAEGVWFLCNPVCGEWRVNNGAVGREGGAKWGRRHGDCVTAWRYLVLESDEAPAELWLRMLVQLPLKIAAIYTSGGRSIHALVRVDAASKLDWDAQRDVLVQLLAPLGADAAAMTAVRLTRLPGCLRGEGLQELLYLDPCADGEPIYKRRVHL